jgi:hypothetical protein
MTRQREYDPTERIGVNAVERIALEQLKWIFRERPIADFGIDAEIEEVRNGKPTGQLTVIQIKTGASYFRGKGHTVHSMSMGDILNIGINIVFRS